MRFDPSRLRRGELIAGVGAAVLLVAMFALPWYGLSGAAQRTGQALGLSTSVDSFNGLTTLRWLMLVTIAVTLALVVLQGACRAPALPVSLSAIATVLGAVTSLALIYRVLITLPGPSGLLGAKPGAYLGLVSVLGLTAGAFMSLREEDPEDPVRTAAIPTVPLGRPR